METKVNIGTVKLVQEGGGVITSQIPESPNRLRELYFGKKDAQKLRVGQLVQFVIDDKDPELARDVAVLSERS